MSSKETTYIIDACNFYHAVFSSFLSSKRDRELEMVNWLKDVSYSSKDEFHLFFDGYFRKLGDNTDNLFKTFCNDEKADFRIKEYALYCVSSNKRAIVVTDDMELSEEIPDGIKVMNCREFYSKMNIHR